MSETKTKMEEDKPKVSKLAVASLVLAVVEIPIRIFELLLTNATGTIALILAVLSIFNIKTSKGKLKGTGIAIAALVIASLGAMAYYYAYYIPHPVIAPRMMCATNLSGLGKSMLIYAHKNDGEYPTPSEWCDLLLQNTDLQEKQFRCDGNKKERCSYAMNPNCEPNSPKDMVLLFETKGGWNQFGGEELLTTENHGGHGCNILFNDTHVKFVTPEEIGQLNWGDK